MSLLSKIKPAGPSGFGYGSTAEDVTAGLDLASRTVVITGCNSGLGKETMRVLGSRGANVIAVARSEDKARAAAAEVGVDITPIACDLSEPKMVAAAANKVADVAKTIDIVIANAGIMALPKLDVKYGLELQYLTNHVGHFIFVTRLESSLAPDARVVILSSDAHRGAPPRGIDFDNLDGRRGYGPWRFYGQSKLANLLFARHLAVRWRGTERTANAVHPGVIKTGLTRHANPLADIGLAIAGPLVFKTIPEGAATQCYVASHPSVAQTSGEYFKDCNIGTSSRAGRDAKLAARLWEHTESLLSGTGSPSLLT